MERRRVDGKSEVRSGSEVNETAGRRGFLHAAQPNADRRRQGLAGLVDVRWATASQHERQDR